MDELFDQRSYVNDVAPTTPQPDVSEKIPPCDSTPARRPPH
ncbi:uncharacterized protein METZ01_LOCUS495049, partial [marine metagenome]